MVCKKEIIIKKGELFREVEVLDKKITVLKREGKGGGIGQN